jgi:hypothetical protein
MIPDTEEQRDYAKGGRVHLTTTTTTPTAVHEWGHILENQVQGVRERAREFLAHRVGDEPSRPLSMVMKGGVYGPDEAGRKDRFDAVFGDDAWYVGKQYQHGSTEVIAMGMQQLYEDSVKFAARDPEYFDFMIGILRGELR